MYLIYCILQIQHTEIRLNKSGVFLMWESSVREVLGLSCSFPGPLFKTLISGTFSCPICYLYKSVNGVVVLVSNRLRGCSGGSGH